MGKQKNILYKIYYDDVLMYLGRTHQDLTDRIRAHLYKNPRVKTIDINCVSKIEYAEFKTEADAFLYEIYYINKYKPPINKDDKACDELTVSLPDVKFKIWKTHLWDKWKKNINDKDVKAQQLELERLKKENNWENRKNTITSKLKNNEITSNEYFEELKSIENEKVRFQYEQGDISFAEYCDKMGFHQLG